MVCDCYYIGLVDPIVGQQSDIQGRAAPPGCIRTHIALHWQTTDYFAPKRNCVGTIHFVKRGVFVDSQY